jgi:hypothetical protein
VRINRLIGFGVLLAFTACETVVEFDLDRVPQLTIISQLTPDAEQKVYVYATQSPSDSTTFYTPENLVVDVTEVESDSTIRLEASQENNKVFYTIPSGFLKEGHKYSIMAFAPGFEIVEAETWIPKPSTISNLVIKDVVIEQSDVHDYKKIIHYKLAFDIEHFESNRYYHLIFYNAYEGIDQLFLLEPESSDKIPFIRHYEYGVLIDKNDLELGAPLEFEFKDWVVNNNNLVRVYVELRTITEGYYKYHSSLTRQLIIRQDPFAEPVTIFNNIEGGYGNFSGFSPNITSSDLPY